jgi:hypothetical protein
VIPADPDIGWWVAFVAIYFVLGVVVWLVLTGMAEEMEEDSFWRVTLATVATFWFVWPLALTLGVVWVLGFGAFAMTLDAWRLRDKS